MAGSILQDTLIYLGSALVFVPIAKKLGIGSVLGYILAGIAIGPFVLGFVGKEGEDVMHTAEFGVVMMLFLIGLELNPQAFWKMRRTITGLGGLQVLGTIGLLFPVFLFGMAFSWQASLTLAMAFAMSSTAIVLQTLKEKGWDRTASGRASFAILLFQDIAVIPILAILPLLGRQPVAVNNHSSGGVAAWLSAHPSLAIALAVAFVFIISRFLIGPFLRIIARTHMRELFTASALFFVTGVAWIMQYAGLSAALGAFMAGVLLANSEYRHELESDIEPFKGLLLGVFFTAVGSTINFHAITAQPVTFAVAVPLILLLKAVVLFFCGRFFGVRGEQGWLLAILLSQIGEFAFVLLASAVPLGILDKAQGDVFMAVITCTMIVSPVLLFLHEKFLSQRFLHPEPDPEYAVNPDEHQHVIIAGFGHFGSTLGRFLRANGVEATILDNDSDRVTLLRKMGFTVHYGDATRLELLEAAGAGKAHILVSAIDSPEKNLALQETVHKHFPHLEIYMRARNRMDAYEFIDRGVNHIYRESTHASLEMGIDVLGALGHRKYTVRRKASEFIKRDEGALFRLARTRHDKETYISSVREEIEAQEELLKADSQFREDRPDNAWDKNLLRG
jgi:monovalent cation:H+ antiporter-2, CPA2 family